MRCKPIQLIVMVALAWWALSPHAWATSSGQGLPMEAPIQKLQQSLCGPIAFGISLCAAMAAFGAIIFLGHMFGDFVRTCLYIALCISILAAAPGFATALGINGASVRGGGRLAFMAFDAQDSMRGAVLQTLYWSGPTGLLCLAVGWWVVGSKGGGQK